MTIITKNSANMQVDTQVMHAAAEKIDTAIQAMEKARTALIQDVLGSLDTCWNGVARDLFEMQYANTMMETFYFIDDYKKVQRLLKDNADICEKAAQKAQAKAAEK